MGKLIVMPGTAEFDETLKGLDRFARTARVTQDSAPVLEDLRGKTLMLNLTKVRGFQCGGFQLGMAHPFAVVGPMAQLEPIRAALADGRLVDITGQDPKTGFKTRDGAVSKVTAEDTGKRAFIGVTPKGEMFVAIPKNKKQAQQYEREIKKTGTLTVADSDQQTTGLSAITAEDVPLDAQGRLVTPDTPTRGKTSGRTNRRQRKPRRG